MATGRCDSSPEGYPSEPCALPSGHSGMHRNHNFTMLWHEGVRDHLEGLGRDIASQRNPCLLTILSLPGMSPSVFDKACHRAGTAIAVKCFDGVQRSIWPKVGDVSGASLHRVLRESCLILGTTPEQNDIHLREGQSRSTLHQKWKRDLLLYQEGYKGIKPKRGAS